MKRVVPLIVAVALLMENIDSSVLSTSLPAMAVDLSTDPIHLKLVLTSYLLALAVFIPASGWAADRFGARHVFRAAIAVFAIGSVACGLSQNLGELVIARTLQGIGGAMMVPVGRLIVLRSVPKEGLVGAMAWLTVPALMGPVIGPLLGGWITTFWSWRWIFWINVPLAILGLVLATRLIPDIREEAPARFDWTGFLMAGPGAAAFLTGATLAGLGLAPPALVAGLLIGGAGLLVAFLLHARRVAEPLIDLSLLRLPTFRISVTAGTLFRMGVGALPFLLPLMFQLGFGLSAFASGALTFVSGFGAMAMKFAAQPLLRRFGFRGVLIGNALVAALFGGLPALFVPATPAVLILGVLLMGGLSRSLQFTALNAIAYADVDKARLSSATSFTAVLQQLSGSLGITAAALALEAAGAWRGVAATDLGNFPFAFGLLTLLALSSAWMFLRLDRDAGEALVQR
jgi:EmrB/QacA subfamily drug resistance transporter